MKCVVFTGGGTGGHIFPGIAVAEVFQKETGIPVMWIGSNKGQDRAYVESASLRFYGIPAGKLRRYVSIENIIDIFKVIGGFFCALILLFQLKPDFVFSKGGFVSVPSCIAAWCLRIPVITHECDFSPGLATKINTRFAQYIFVSYPKTALFFSPSVQSKICCTGNPVREAFYNADAQKGKEFIGYRGFKPILFVQGGSLGALQINHLIEKSCVFLTQHFFVVHQTGARNLVDGQKIHAFLAEHYPQQVSSYAFFPFIGDAMPDVLAASHVVVSRAGANVLWETAVAGKPLILIPLEKGSSRGDQIENAAFFSEKGAAIVLHNKQVSSTCFCDKLQYLLDKPEAAADMAASSAALAVGRPARTISTLLMKWVHA